MPLSTDGVPIDDEGVPMQTKILAAAAYKYCKTLIIDSVAEMPQHGSVNQLLANRNAFTCPPISPLAGSSSGNKVATSPLAKEKNFGERLSTAFNNDGNH